jgi:hypothetical protein
MAEGKLSKAVPIQFSLGEGLDVGGRRLAGGLQLQTAVRAHGESAETRSSGAHSKGDKIRSGANRVRRRDGSGETEMYAQIDVRLAAQAVAEL